MINNKEIIEDIFDQIYLREECKADSLVRIYDECSCRGCIYSYTVNTVSIKNDIGKCNVSLYME